MFNYQYIYTPIPPTLNKRGSHIPAYSGLCAPWHLRGTCALKQCTLSILCPILCILFEACYGTCGVVGWRACDRDGDVDARHRCTCAVNQQTPAARQADTTPSARNSTQSVHNVMSAAQCHDQLQVDKCLQCHLHHIRNLQPRALPQHTA